MKDSNHDMDLIEQYFEGTLSAQEQTEVKERSLTDAEFSKLFDREKDIVNGIRYDGLLNDLHFLKYTEEGISYDTSRNSVHVPWKIIGIAASIALTIAVYFFLPKNLSTQELFEAHYTPYPNMFEPTMRSIEETQNMRTNAFKAYDERNYTEAARLFRELLKIQEEPGILMLLGNCNLILGNYEESIQNFQLLIKNYDELDMQAKWYLGLCYLKSGDKENAKKTLTELSETEIDYALRARDLLKKFK